MDMKLEVVILPVSDVDRTKGFYVDQLGWRLDADFPINDGYRIVQVTPPGSECSIIFGQGLTQQEPGTLHGLQLTVTDILKAQEELTSHGCGGEMPVDLRVPVGRPWASVPPVAS
jgi:catechol 2,3-dioxygenase-like lactoylglutathione lyase family enzyme